MPLTKKTIAMYALAVVLICIISVLTIPMVLSLVFGTSFTLSNTYSVVDDNGFPSLSASFTCSGTATVKIIGPDSRLIDTDFFLKGTHDAMLRLAEYRHDIAPGDYKLRAYDNNNKEIFSKTISLGDSDVSILSCEQKWFKREIWVGGYSFFGLKLNVQNNGAVPIYPYSLSVVMDADTLSGLVLPCVIAPGENEYVDCFIYRKSSPTSSTFSVELKDVDEDILTTDSFSVEIENNVVTKQFSIGTRSVNLPKSDALFSYYSNLDRTLNEDYSSYIFDAYDDQYVDVLTEIIMFGQAGLSTVEKINYVASLVQNQEYKKDSDTNSSYEYPNYPIETLFNDNIGRDCEDKAILTACLLNNIGYNVALFRFPNHMAVGVNLSKSTVPLYNYYVDNYFFLETTTEGKPVGFIPEDYKELSSDVIVYPVSSRPLLIHSWAGSAITIFTNTERGDFVKVTAVVENIGSSTAEDVKVEAGFFKSSYYGEEKIKFESETISSIEPGTKKEVTISVEIPKSPRTLFKTRVYLDGVVVDEKESVSSFP